MHAVTDAALAVAENGTADADLVLTTRNTVTPTVFNTRTDMKREKAELVALFERAQHEILYQTWDWQADSEASRAVLDAVAALNASRLARQATGPPVVVRILVNMMPFKPTSYIADVVKAVEELGLDPSMVRVEVAAWKHALVGANHSKHVVVDGHEAVLTGANTNDNYVAPVANLDAGFHVTGDVARALRSDFVEAWSHGRLFTCPGDWRREARRRRRRAGGPNKHQHNLSRLCWDDTDAVNPVPPVKNHLGEGVPVLTISHPAHGWPWHRSWDNPQNQAYLTAVERSSTRIRIMTPNINDRKMRKALVEAAVRGTRIELMLSLGFEKFPQSLPSRGGPNHKNVDWIYKEMTKLGVADPCSVMDIRWYSFDGEVPVEQSAGPPASHTKFLAADGEIAIVGSSNQDIQSWHNSREVGIVVGDAELTQTWERQLFEPNYGKAIRVDQCSGVSRAVSKK